MAWRTTWQRHGDRSQVAVLQGQAVEEVAHRHEPLFSKRLVLRERVREGNRVKKKILDRNDFYIFISLVRKT